MARKGMQWFDWVAIVLIVVGAINWGLVGAFNWNLVEAIFGKALFTKILYVLVGVAGVMSIFRLWNK